MQSKSQNITFLLLATCLLLLPGDGMRLYENEVDVRQHDVQIGMIHPISVTFQTLFPDIQLKEHSTIKKTGNQSLAEAFLLSPTPAARLRGRDHQKISGRQSASLMQSEANKVLSNVMVSVSFANDIFNNTDHYFTNGIGIEVIHPFISKLPLSHFLFPRTSGAEVLYGLQFTHNMYTPLNPDLKEISYGDRPFAATMSLSIYKISINHFTGSRISSGIRLGVMGPAALGGEVQSIIHDIEPQGWVHQIGNSIIANYFIHYEAGLMKQRALSLNYLAGFNIGSLQNNATAGLVIRYGNEARKLEKQEKSSRGLNYSFFLRSQLNLVAYDATLQGNMFRSNSDYTLGKDEISRFTFYAQAGFSMNYQGISLSVEQNYLSPEFNGALPHRWLQIKTSFSL